MLERTQSRRESFGPGPVGLGDLFSAAAVSPAMVTVSHGPYSEELPVNNMTVGEIRVRYRDRFDIDPHSQAILDGTEAGDNTVVRAGQVLLFSRKAGEKGRG
jgi:hypothetical protein